MEEKKKKIKNTDCEIISWVPFYGNFEIELHKIKFPIEIYNAFWDRYKANNETDIAYMKIKELHSCMRLDLSDIYYTNFISKDNLDDGWIFSETDDDLFNIKARLKAWLETLNLDGFNEIIKKLSFEKEKIIITKEDLISKNYKSKIFLSYMSKKLSQNLSIDLTDDGLNRLNFTFVNNSNNFRLVGLTENNFINVDGEKFLYGYYLDFKIISRFSSNEVFLNISIGQLRLVSKSAKTYFGKGLNPYIFINSKDAKGNYKATAMIGKINYNDNNESKYSWDWSLNSISKIILEKLPYPSELLDNPLKYAQPNDGLSILIPYGTHISTSNATDSSSGVDYFTREKILDAVYNCLSKEEVFLERPRYQLNNKSKTIGFKDDVLDGLDVLNIEMLYLNEDTRKLFELFESDFNNIEESFKKIEEKSFEDINEECRLSAVKLLYKSIYPTRKDVAQGVKLKFNYIDYSYTDAITIPKGQSAESFLEDGFLNLELDESINISIIEYEDADYFLFNKMNDLFKDIRYVNASFNNKTTQFINPIKKIDIENSKDKKIKEYYSLVYGKIVNTILESIRQTGIITPKDLSSVPTNIGVVEKNGHLIFVAIRGNKAYGRINSSKWMDYHSFLVEMSLLTKKGDISKLNNNILEVAIDEFIEQYKDDDIVLNLHYHSLKRIMPYLNDYGSGNINIKVDIEKGEKEYHAYNNDNVSILIIDDTIEAEWVPLAGTERQTTSLPNVFVMIDENTALSVSDTQGVTQQKLKKAVKGKKEDSALNISKSIYSKNEPCLIYCAKVSISQTSENLCSIAHQLKRNSSIQYFRPKGMGLECTKLPLPLHLCQISSKLLKI